MRLYSGFYAKWSQQRLLFIRRRLSTLKYKVIELAKKLQLEDLEESKELEEIGEEELEGLYDLIVPPGTPSYIIYDLVEEFDLEPLDRKINVTVVEATERDVIVLRGKLEEVQAAEKFLKEELEAWVNS